MIKFVPEGHRYYNDVTGREYLPVSSLLSKYGFIDTSWIDRYVQRTGIDVAQRGTDIHRTLQLLAIRATQARHYADDPNYPYIKAGADFLESWGAHVLATELVVHDDKFVPIAGTIDIVAKTLRGDVVIVDWKSGSPTGSHPLQMAAYKDILTSTCEQFGFAPPARAFTVHVNKHGKFKVCDTFKGISYDSTDFRVAYYSMLRLEQMRDILGSTGEVSA